MKKVSALLLVILFVWAPNGKTQVVLNELYTDPGAGKHEFFELYNTSASSTPTSMNNYTLLCFYELSGQKGWLVMDLPDISVVSKGYFVGSAALPFNYQGVTNSTETDFNWNSILFTSNSGYVKKWVKGTLNLLDGNLNYDEAILPANFNDFLFRRTAAGASYSVFLYANGVLTNTFIGGTGGSSTVINDIVNMPPLYIDMSGVSPDFTINFSTYGSLPVESTTQNAGSDNGYIREADGACAQWVKSSAQVQHTPKATNGTLTSDDGSISVAAAINRGTLATGSVVNYDIVGGPVSAFPVEIQIYLDNGNISGGLDGGDTYVESNTETIITQGPFYTQFHPYNAHILIVVKTNAGCLDKILFIPNTGLLSVKLVSFEGVHSNNAIKFSWEISGNETSAGFELEKSYDGENFTTAALVLSSTKTGTEHYSITHINPHSSKIFFRLKIMDKSGKTGYSKSLSYETGSIPTEALKIRGNPVTHDLSFNFNAGMHGVLDIKLIDMHGRVLVQKRITANEGHNLIHLPLGPFIKEGIFILDVYDGRSNYRAPFIKL